MKIELKLCEAFHAAVGRDPNYVPENPQHNFSLKKDDPLPRAPYHKRIDLYELFTHEGWWTIMREAKEPESELLKVRDLMFARWNFVCRGTYVDDERGTGRSTASTGSTLPIGAKRKIGSTAGTEAKPSSKRVVHDDDL